MTESDFDMVDEEKKKRQELAHRLLQERKYLARMRATLDVEKDAEQFETYTKQMEELMKKVHRLGGVSKDKALNVELNS